MFSSTDVLLLWVLFTPQSVEAQLPVVVAEVIDPVVFTVVTWNPVLYLYLVGWAGGGRRSSQLLLPAICLHHRARCQARVV